MSTFMRVPPDQATVVLRYATREVQSGEGWVLVEVPDDHVVQARRDGAVDWQPEEDTP